MNIDIVGEDWEKCQLQETPELKQEILDDLKIEIEKYYLQMNIGDLVTIKRRDNPKDFFQFMVLGDEEEAGEVVLCYYGCGS